MGLGSFGFLEQKERRKISVGLGERGTATCRVKANHLIIGRVHNWALKMGKSAHNPSTDPEPGICHLASPSSSPIHRLRILVVLTPHPFLHVLRLRFLLLLRFPLLLLPTRPFSFYAKGAGYLHVRHLECPLLFISPPIDRSHF